MPASKGHVHQARELAIPAINAKAPDQYVDLAR